MKSITYPRLLVLLILFSIITLSGFLIQDEITPALDKYSTDIIVEPTLLSSNNKFILDIIYDKITISTIFNNQIQTYSFNENLSLENIEKLELPWIPDEIWYGKNHQLYYSYDHSIYNHLKEKLFTYDTLHIRSNNYISYTSNNELIIYDYQDTYKIQNHDSLLLEKLSVSDKYFATIGKNASKTSWMINIYTYDTNGCKVIFSDKLSPTGIYKAHELSMTVIDDDIYLATVIKDTKASVNISRIYHYDISNNSSSYESLTLDAYSPQVTFHGHHMFYSNYGYYGIEEIGTSKTTYDNLFSRDLLTHESYQYTKSLNHIYDYHYLNYHNYDYLFYTTKNRNLQLNMVSNNPTLIENSKKISNSMVFSQLANSLTVIALSFSMSLFSLLALLLPVLFTITPIAMIKLTWIEQFPNRIVLASIFIYLLGKIVTMGNILNIDGILEHPNLPIHLSSYATIIVSMLLITIYAFFGLKVFQLQNSKSNPIIQFLVFYSLDAIGFILLILPYPFL